MNNRMEDMRKYLNYDSIRENIIYRLISTERNRDLLKDIPHMDYMDLSIVFQCMVSQKDFSMTSILVDNVHTRLWNVTVEELYQDAEKNTPRLLPYVIRDMAEIEAEIKREESLQESCQDGYRKEFTDNEMYVLSNRNMADGASCILYPGLLNILRYKAGSSFFVIPVSVHHLLILPAANTDEAPAVRSMVREINDTWLVPDDILSYCAYYYDAEEGRLYIC